MDTNKSVGTLIIATYVPILSFFKPVGPTVMALQMEKSK